jgi:hypothetical protein
MSRLNEIKESVNTIKQNLDNVVEKVFNIVQENIQSAEKNRIDISEINRKLDALTEDKNISENDVETEDVNGKTCYKSLSDIINEKVEMVDMEISLYKDAVGIKTDIGQNTFDIGDFDFHSKTGKVKKVLKNFRIFVKSEGCVSTEVFLLKRKKIEEVKSDLGHFNTNLKRVFNIKEKGSIFNINKDKYALKFKTYDKTDMEFFKKNNLERVFK